MIFVKHREYGDQKVLFYIDIDPEHESHFFIINEYGIVLSRTSHPQQEFEYDDENRLKIIGVDLYE